MNADRPTLVVVDDEAPVLKSLHDQFRREYQVLTYLRGDEALAAMADIDPSVVLSDQRMPGMSGVAFLRQVKELRPDATRLLFTGYADINAVVDAINEGHVFRYLNKPWEAGEMESAVRQAMQHHHLLVERRRLIAELQESNAKLRENDALKKAFIEVASHELNTPVAVILGMVDLWRMMLGAAPPEVERVWLDRVQAAGKRLAGTVERMLKLLRADNFEDSLALKELNVESLVHRAVADISPFLMARNQTVEVQIEEELGLAELDEAKVGDILTNLLVNAIKFTPDGGMIRLSAAPLGSDRVRLLVTDTGVGISAEEVRHLFEPFFTGYDTLHHSSGEYQFGKKGIGLGLCLVKTFVELHGGSVDVISRPGHGSTFGVNLPRNGVGGQGSGDGVKREREGCNHAGRAFALVSDRHARIQVDRRGWHATLFEQFHVFLHAPPRLV